MLNINIDIPPYFKVNLYKYIYLQDSLRETFS